MDQSQQRKSWEPALLGALGATLYGVSDVVTVVQFGRLNPGPLSTLALLLVTTVAMGLLGALVVGLAGLFGQTRKLGRAWPLFAGLALAVDLSFAVFWFSDPPPFQEPFFLQGNPLAFVVIGGLLPILAIYLLSALAERGRVAVSALVTLAVMMGNLLSASSGPALGEAEPDAPNVLLVTLDTSRGDRFDGYPIDVSAFDQVADQGARFKNAVSQVPVTGPSHATILSGRTPWENNMLLNGEAVRSDLPWLPEALAGQGYETAAFVSAWVLLKNLGFNRGFSIYDDDFGSIKGLGAVLPGRVYEMIKRHLEGVAYLLERRGDFAVDDALYWLEGRDSSRPWFAWVHLFDAHGPYAPPPPYSDRYYRGRDPFDPANDSMTEIDHLPPYLAKSLHGVTDAEWVVAQYDGEVAYADVQLGRLLAFLDDSGQTEDTIVVVVGDHGEGLGEHGEWFDHGDWLYEHDLHVPFAIRYPGVVPAGSVVETPVELTDVTPTVLDYLGLAMDQSTGVSLRAAIEEGDIPREFARSMAFDRAPNRAKRQQDPSFKPTYRQAGVRVPDFRYLFRDAEGYDPIIFACGATGSPRCARIKQVDDIVGDYLKGHAEDLLSGELAERRQTSSSEQEMLKMLGYTDPTE